MAGVSGERRGYGDVIALGQHFVELFVAVEAIDILIPGARRNVAAQRENAHAHRFGAPGDGAADIAVPDNAHGLLADLCDVEHVPVMRGLRTQHTGKILGEVERACHDEFAQRLAERAAAVGQQDGALDQLRGEEAVEPGGARVDPFELRRRGEHLQHLGLGAAPAEENAGVLDFGAEAVGGVGDFDADVRAEGFQQLHGRLGRVGENEEGDFTHKGASYHVWANGRKPARV